MVEGNKVVKTKKLSWKYPVTWKGATKKSYSGEHIKIQPMTDKEMRKRNADRIHEE